jgi:hypothetical protein
MTTKGSQKRSPAPSGAPSVKMFLTAASLTAIIGGWAGFTVQQAHSADTEAYTETADTNQVAMDFPPMPTLVSPPGVTLVSLNPTVTPTPRVVNVGSSGGSSGNGSAHMPASDRTRQPATRTHSSRP